MNDRPIPKHIFFSLIQKRLFRYTDAIWGLGGWSHNVASAIHYNSEEMKRLQALDDYIGDGFWGYGINNICDGNECYSLLDVEEIKKLPELNKHHQPYRYLAVLTFKVEGENIYISTFAIDSVGVGVNTRLNTKYSLRNFENARIVTLNNKLSVEFIFKNLPRPISFQLDDYYVPGYLVGASLGKYYIEGIKKEAKKFEDISYTKHHPDRPMVEDMLEVKEGVHSIENALRKCVAVILAKGKGKEYYEELLPSEIKKSIRNRISELVDSDPKTRKEDYNSIYQSIHFCDIDHLKKLIVNDNNWSLFETIFIQKEKTIRYFDQLSSLRNGLMHNRTVPKLILIEGEAAIEWFVSILERNDKR